MSGLAHLGVFASDTEKASAFYTRHLGFKRVDNTTLPTPQGELKLTLLEQGGFVIELIERPVASEMAIGVKGVVDHICLEVEGLDAMVTRLRGEGVRFESSAVSVMPGLFGGIKNIFLAGPDGVRIELMEYLSKRAAR